MKPITKLALLFGSCVVGLLTAMLVGACISAPVGTTTYDIIKGVAVPLFGPIVAILVPTILFYLIPLWQTREKLTIELFASYHAEEMRKARADAWTYFVVQRRHMSVDDANKRLDGFLAFLTERDENCSVDATSFEMYQKLSRVLDFFNIVNTALDRGALDPRMVRSFLGYYYIWWSDELLSILRRRPRVAGRDDPRYELQWLTELTALNAACGKK